MRRCWRGAGRRLAKGRPERRKVAESVRKAPPGVSGQARRSSWPVQRGPDARLSTRSTMCTTPFHPRATLPTQQLAMLAHRSACKSPVASARDGPARCAHRASPCRTTAPSPTSPPVWRSACSAKTCANARPRIRARTAPSARLPETRPNPPPPFFASRLESLRPAARMPVRARSVRPPASGHPCTSSHPPNPW